MDDDGNDDDEAEEVLKKTIESSAFFSLFIDSKEIKQFREKYSLSTERIKKILDSYTPKEIPTLIDHSDLDKRAEEFFRTRGDTLNLKPSKLYELARNGNAEAMYDYAITLTCLPEGLLTDKEQFQCIFFMWKSSKKGNEEALAHIALLHITGESIWIPQNENEGKRILLDLKDSKSPIVQNTRNLFNEIFFKLDDTERSLYLYENASKAEKKAREHYSFHSLESKSISDSFEISEEFILKKGISNDDRELFAQYINQNVLKIFNLDNMNLLKILLLNDNFAQEEVLRKWEMDKNTLNPRSDFQSLKPFTLEQIKKMEIKPYI